MQNKNTNKIVFDSLWSNEFIVEFKDSSLTDEQCKMLSDEVTYIDNEVIAFSVVMSNNLIIPHEILCNFIGKKSIEEVSITYKGAEQNLMQVILNDVYFTSLSHNKSSYKNSSELECKFDLSASKYTIMNLVTNTEVFYFEM